MTDRDSRWVDARRLFEQAVDRPSRERRDFVRAAAREDPWLLEAVLELLEFDAAESPLDQPLLRLADAADEASTVEVGDQVGKFKVLEHLGAGGMGTVFRAERVEGAVRQEAAVKVLHAAELGGDGRRRFLQEQRILAGLHHPRIAALFDFGTTPSGVAYLAMELVDGSPITDYADAHRLSIAERIRLVLEVCDAVHHAHRLLVVHRDLKPANILVTEDGDLRLVDFGIAKMLEPGENIDGSATRADLRVMTPNYVTNATPRPQRWERISSAISRACRWKPGREA